MTAQEVRQKIKLAAESETQRRGENIWCRKGSINEAGWRTGGGSHLRDGPLIIHGALSTPIEGENHYCEPESSSSLF